LSDPAYSHSTHVTTKSLPPGTPAVLLLSATGQIAAASPIARALWQASEEEIVGEHFATLFFFEIVSEKPYWLEEQWDVLLAATSEQAILLQAQPREGPLVLVRVRLEKAMASAIGYFAYVEIPAATPPSPNVLDEHLAALAWLTDRGTAGFFDLNFKENRVYYSPAWKRLLGYADAELPNTYNTWLTLIHPEDSAAAPDRLGKKHVVGTRTFSVEFRMRHRDGHDVWLQSTGLQSIAADGTLDRVVGTQLDITERKETEEAALASDERFQALAGERGMLGAFEMDFVAGHFWFSPAWKAQLGYAKDNIPEGPEILTLVLPRAQINLGVNTYFQDLAAGRATFMEITHLRHKDGRLLPAILGARCEFSRKNELARLTGFHCLLPERAPASSNEDLLPAALLDATFAVLSEGLLVTDRQGILLYLNPAASRLLDVSCEAGTGQPCRKYFRLINLETGERGADPVEQAIKATQLLPLINEHALLPAADESDSTSSVLEAAPRPIVWTARAVRDASDRPFGVVIVFRDPNEMHLTPDELVRTNRFETMGHLAGSLIQDFGNLLTKILGAVSLAQENHDFDTLQIAEKACLEAKDLNRQLLAFVKGEGLGSTRILGPKDILDDAVKLAGAREMAEISVEVAEKIASVQVDRAQILQVFQNLILNALQAMPPAPHHARVQLTANNIVLTADQAPPLPAGNYVAFEVRDNASGIPPEHLEKIWERFFSTRKHNTGLGLDTVLSIVRQHGGQIGVTSTPGVGSLFTLFLPVAERPPEVEVRTAAPRFATGRILFMEDDVKIAELAGNMLQSLDYKYDSARNGEEAIVFYKRYLSIGRPYDVVIMDLTIEGGMGGEECFKVLQGLDPGVRAIVSSGYDNETMAKRFLEMGFCGYLMKPYRVTDLGKMLKTVLG
jgi:two-component system cell cycle sensor histidine kinase/response regulator CckA